MAVQNGTPDRDTPLRQSEQRFRTIFEHAPTGIAITNLDAVFEHCNPAYCALLGYTEEELHQIAFASLVHPEDRETNLAEIYRLRTGKAPYFEIENRYVHKSGRSVWVRKWVSVLPDAAGQPAHLMALVTDITERRHAEQALRDSEERLQLMADSLPVLIAYIGADGRYQFNNAGYEQWFALPRDACKGRHMSEVVGQTAYRTFKPHVEAVLAGQARVFEAHVPYHGGRTRDVLAHYIPHRNKEGQVLGFFALILDLTERKQTEQALRESEERLRMAQAAGGVGTFDWDFETNTAQCSEQYFHVMGAVPRASNIVTFDEWQSWLHAEDRARVLSTLSESLEKEQEGTTDYRIVRSDGQTRWISYRGRITRDVVGKPIRMLGAVQDITDRKRAEEELLRLTVELRARVEELYTLLDILPGAVLMADPLCRQITGNRAFYEILGLPYGVNASLTAEQPALPAGTRVYRDGRELSPHEFPMQATGLTSRRIMDFDHDLVFPDGRVVTLLANTAPLLDEHGKIRGVVGAYMDISERKRAEAALRDREARLAAILNTAADAIITIDANGVIQSVNAAAEGMFGYTAAEMIGQNVKMLMPASVREQHDRYLARYRETAEKHIIGIGREVDGRRKDGSTFPVDLAVSEVGHLNLFTGLLRDISLRKELERDVVEIASQEQRRIGQDLHDSVSQELTALSMLAGDLAETLRSDPAAAPPLVERLVLGLERSKQELRAVMRGLLPVSIDAEGLMSALLDLATRTRQESKVSCAFDYPEPFLVEDNLVATHLYLIAQEAVRNAVKHARCRSIRIFVESDHDLVLRVQDDGIGIADQAGEGHSGLGLRIMRNRAAIIRATLTIEPAKPTGTVITCVLARTKHER